MRETHMRDAENAFGARASLTYSGGTLTYYRLQALRDLGEVDRLPHTVKIVLENVL